MTATTPPRRRFIATAGAGAATLGFPMVARSQTQTLRFQSTWPQKDIFHEYAQDYVPRVNEMSGGRLRLDLLAAGAVVGALQMQDAVIAGALDGGHGVTAYWYGKHKAYSLFGTPPAFGWNANQMLGWIRYGGGQELYDELVQQVLGLDLVGFFTGPMPTQPLGWFKKEVAGADDLKNMKFRTVGLAADLPPLPFAGLRYAFAALCLLPFALATAEHPERVPPPPAGGAPPRLQARSPGPARSRARTPTARRGRTPPPAAPRKRSKGARSVNVIEILQVHPALEIIEHTIQPIRRKVTAVRMVVDLDNRGEVTHPEAAVHVLDRELTVRARSLVGHDPVAHAQILDQTIRSRDVARDAMAEQDNVPTGWLGPKVGVER